MSTILCRTLSANGGDSIAATSPVTFTKSGSPRSIRMASMCLMDSMIRWMPRNPFKNSSDLYPRKMFRICSDHHTSEPRKKTIKCTSLLAFESIESLQQGRSKSKH